MELPECLIKAHIKSSFAGAEMSQTWNDLAAWEESYNSRLVNKWGLVIPIANFFNGYRETARGLGETIN
jgi:hypothetical protein